MQKMKKKRKGFTLTELAIVIAVIAILIAVLVPTFVSLINSANDSADQQAVKSMNTALAASEAIDGKPSDPIEAMNVLEENGFNVENYVALDSGNTIYYDSSYNRCLIWTVDSNGNGSITYPSEMQSYYPNASGVAANWYTFASIYKMTATTEVSNSNLSTTLSNMESGSTVILKATEPLTLSKGTDLSSSDKETHVTLDLDGNTLTITDVTGVTGERVTLKGDSGATLYIKNGTIEVNPGSGSIGGDNAEFKVEAGCSLTLENVTYNASGSGIFPNSTAAQVNIIDSTIISKGNYAIATNSSSTENYGVFANISGSYIESESACGICWNTGSTLTISDSEIVGVTQGVMVRAGTATITNTKISASIATDYEYVDGNNTTNFSDFLNYTNGSSSWSQGFGIALGAVVVGNISTGSGGYEADAVVTLTNCTLSYEITGTGADDYSAYLISLYVADGSEGMAANYSTSVTVSGCTMNNYVINYGNIVDLSSYTGTIYSTWNSTKWE